MKFCQSHWDRLRQAVVDRGLGAFIADSGEEVARRMATQADGGATLDNFEPLMGAHNLLVSNLVSVGGPQVLFMDGCPLCFANEQHNLHCADPASCGGATAYYDDWIDRAADDTLEEYKRRLAESSS